jgi:hypothetical protein
MQIFLRHAAGIDVGTSQPAATMPAPDAFTVEAARWVETMCDEAMIDDQNG